MLLAIETATRTGSVALIDDTGVLRHRVLIGERDHGRTLASEVHTLLDGALSEVVAYGVSIGPGSFTGLRVGVSFIKGLAIVHDRPVIGVSTLLAISEASKLQSVLPCLDARGGEVFAAYGDRLPEGLYRVETVLETLAGVPLVIAGDGAPVLEKKGLPAGWSVAPASMWVPEARTVAKLAWDAHLRGEGQPALDVEPVYLQLAAAERRRLSDVDPTPTR